MDIGTPQREIYVEPLELPEPLREPTPMAEQTQPGLSELDIWGSSKEDTKMRRVTFYLYDPQLRPDTIGADFETDAPNDFYTLRYEEEDKARIGDDVFKFINERKKDK